MADDVLKAFVVSLGWKIDREGERRVTETIKGVTRQAGHLATAFGAMALAVSVAVAKVAKSFDTLEFVSRRTGASVQNLRSLQYAFSQIGGSSEQATGAIESFSRSLRTNPGIRKFITDLGVATTEGGKARDSVDVLVDSIDAIRKKNPHYVGSQYAELLGIDEGTYEMLSRQLGEFKAYQAEYGRIAASIGLDNEKAGKAGASFQRSLTSLTALATSFAQKLLIDLAPALERVAKGLLAWVEAHPREIAEFFASVGRGIDAFTKSIENGDLARTIEDIGTKLLRVGKAIENIVGLLTRIGLIGSGDSMLGRVFTHLFGTKEEVTAQIERDMERQQKAERPGLLSRGYNWARRKIGLSTDEGGGTGAGTPQDAPGGSKASIAGKTFRDKAPGVMKRLMEDFGLSKEEAGVVLGNLGHESAGFTAFKEGGNGPGRGWAQWTDPGRKRRFFEYANQRGLDPQSDEANYGFLRWELQNTHKSSIDALKRGRTTEEKMYAFEDKFEGARVKAYGSRNRYMRDAIKAYDAAQNAPVPPPPANNNPVPPKAPFLKVPPGGGITAEQFNDRFGAAAPMGSMTTNNSSSDNRRFDLQHKTDIHISGANDPAKTAGSIRDTLNRGTGLSLRDAQTAIR